MPDIAASLRAQKRFSTDPDRLEREAILFEDGGDDMTPTQAKIAAYQRCFDLAMEHHNNCVAELEKDNITPDDRLAMEGGASAALALAGQFQQRIKRHQIHVAAPSEAA
jgi:hypothetical protein